MKDLDTMDYAFLKSYLLLADLMESFDLRYIYSSFINKNIS